ncbi:hypothetical protein, partial [Methylobacterium oxalidis]|uniref:hypothetical protein n=1 Tax=Methylobacterium oxalidis TaxID=944322 RepID=UPI003315CA2C
NRLPYRQTARHPTTASRSARREPRPKPYTLLKRAHLHEVRVFSSGRVRDDLWPIVLRYPLDRLMAVPPAPPIIQAAAFTLGCVLIHAFRRHPERVSSVLTPIAFVLLLTVAVAAIPANDVTAGSEAQQGISLGSAMQ